MRNILVRILVFRQLLEYYLTLLHSVDTNIRAQAEAYLNQAVEAQYVSIWNTWRSTCIYVAFLDFQGPFLLALCGELATEGKDTANRQLAGIYIKNMISAEVFLFPFLHVRALTWQIL